MLGQDKLRLIATLMWQDLSTMWRNMNLLFTILAPVWLALIFNLMFTSTSDTLPRLDVAVYQPDDSQLVQILRQNEQVRLLEVVDPSQAQEAVAGGVVAGLVLPPQFDEAVFGSRQANLTVYLNQNRPQSEQVRLQRLLEQSVRQMVSQPLPAQIQWQPIGQTRPAHWTDGFRLEHYLLILLLMLVIAIIGFYVVPLLLVTEKEKHTLPVLLSYGIKPGWILLSKALIGGLYALSLSLILLLMNHTGPLNWPSFWLMMGLSTLLLILVGLCLGQALNSTAQVNGVASITMLFLILPHWLLLARFQEGQSTWWMWPSVQYLTALRQALDGEATGAAFWASTTFLSIGSVAFGLMLWWLLRHRPWQLGGQLR